ncbi:DUF2339 domain-containing protein [Natronobacterium gregoryi]|uniref:DUF2339 domain-containing protein n=2 Tax=Natronobacterium gregoryi TaxID=44930 RepID=L0AHT9_NATGS|nr:DUF2339 domain-containing protein [Natronobacterium gregoryi]AFZ73376.1 putative membrane protein (DUF2339) [Natronobacterium gregoryi SP2]ELY68572.1 hypothetical protein C490_09143 [Natronobacterium gregoryi SP2]PLK19657.1 DUF2339 domain-containing protein [Natronobacterium gregoryi SP2]SFI73727.1 Predicted membrane protein [Natronobacterium gregoryi]
MNDDEDLRQEVHRLRDDVDALHRRLESLEDRLDANEDRSGDRSTVAEATADSPAEDVSSAECETDSGTSTIDDAELPDKTPADSRDWEFAVGVRWLGLAGAAALVIGVAFFVQLAIEIGLLGPLGRVAVGTLGGLALFGAGRYAATRQEYVRWGRIAAGAGMAVAYLSVYAAYGFEGYREAIGTPLWAVLAALTLLVGTTALVSIRDGAPLVVGEAFLLGYVTAALSLEAATLVVTPAYLLLLAGGVVAVATVEPWSRLVLSSTFATYGVFLLWLLDLEPSAAAIATAAILTLLVYLAGGYVLRDVESARFENRRYRAQVIALPLVNAAFGTLLLENAVDDVAPDAVGLGAIAVAAILAGAYAVTDRRPVRTDGTAAAGSVVFLALGVVVVADTFAGTVGALAVVCAGVLAATHLEEPGFRYGSHAVAGATVLKLLAVDTDELPAFDAAEPVATLTGRPVAFALTTAVLYGLAWWFATDRATLSVAESRYLPPLEGSYATVATGLAVLVLALELSGLGVSVAWVLFGLVLLTLGFTLDRRGLRALAIGVFGLATAKVFLVDTRDLDTVSRTLSFLVLGAVLLVASYAYARSRPDVSLALGDALGLEDEECREGE